MVSNFDLNVFSRLDRLQYGWEAWLIKQHLWSDFVKYQDCLILLNDFVYLHHALSEFVMKYDMLGNFENRKSILIGVLLWRNARTNWIEKRF